MSDFINTIKNCYDEDCQIKNKEYNINNEKISLFYIETLIDKQLFADGILAPIEVLKNQQTNKEQDIINLLKKNIILISSIEDLANETQALEKIFTGNVVIASQKKIIACPIYGLSARGVEEPPTSRVVKGPREGFVEDISKNLGLIRKRLKTVDLKIKDLYVGERSSTQVSIIYLKSVAKPEIIKEIIKRISAIKIDAIIDSYYIESFLETNKIKFFRRAGNTEKPDVLCSKILEGRIGILVDGSPVALTVPFMIFEDLQSPQDYYTIPIQATFVRVMRMLGLIFAILMPGVFVALQSYHYRILPINFLISLLSSIEGLSVPPLIELLIVLFLFEVITEASLQMPNSLGMALSIVGALALGNTAVDAGIISPPSIVIVAISSVALYIIPEEIAETRILRVLFTVIGGIAGLYGIITCFIILTAYLTSIKSFGVPYMAPFAPNIKGDKKDGFIKRAIQEMSQRPELIAGKNKTRIGKMNTDDFLSETQMSKLQPSKHIQEKQANDITSHIISPKKNKKENKK